jgi:hypothetical protein
LWRGVSYGALAPPLEPTLPEDFSGSVFSLEAFSEDSPAEVPPAAPLSEEPDVSSELSPVSLPSVEPVDSSPAVDLAAVVAVVDVEVVSVASFSAAVSFGGVISGVLLAVTSETLLPPHELRPKPERSISALAASASERERCGAMLTRRAGPSGARRWDSR